jgi:outer membrane protein TolC
VLSLSLREAVERGLRYNLGLIESSQGTAEVRAQRLRALSALLPNLSVKGEQAFENISLKEIGLRLPPMPGVPALPATTGPFSYQDARVSLTQSIYSDELHNRYRVRQSTEQASALSTRDARDVVVYAVGVAYLQVVASAARVETAQAQLASARELDQQTADQLKNEVSPEIDSIRAQVERQSAEQRLINATNDFEKDKLAQTENPLTMHFYTGWVGALLDTFERLTFGEAIFVGFESSIRRMRALMDEARATATPARKPASAAP